MPLPTGLAWAMNPGPSESICGCLDLVFKEGVGNCLRLLADMRQT